MSHKNYRPWSPEQDYLIPPRPREWLPEGHLVYFILDVVGQLDLRRIEDVIQAKDPRGVVPYHPRMLVALLLYAYATGTYSSRRIARATYDDVAMRFIAADSHPHFTTIADFRRVHLAALGGLFVQALRMCQEAGLVKLGHISLDGTKILANASKHAAMSYDRMKAEEAKLEAEMAALLARGEKADSEDDARLGDGVDDEDVPAELARREVRQARIRAAREALEAEARLRRAAELRAQADGHDKTAAESEDPKQRAAARTLAAKRREAADKLDPPDDPPPTSGGVDVSEAPNVASGDSGTSDAKAAPEDGPQGLPTHRVSTRADGTPDPKAQRNFTDPDSKIMKSHGDYVQAYNAHAVVDADHQIIVAAGLSNQAPDCEYLIPMLAWVLTHVGQKPDKCSGDAGFFSAENAEWCEQNGLDAYLSTARQRRGAPGAEIAAGTTGPPPDPSPPSGDNSPPPPTARQKMDAKLRTPEGKKTYAARKTIPEPVFGQIKEGRGFRRFSFRSRKKVASEWSLVCAVHNLVKLFRFKTENIALSAAG